jgi:hypothetical protein
MNENLSSNIFPISGRGFSTSLAALMIPIIININGIQPNTPRAPIFVTESKISRIIDRIMVNITSPKIV